MLDCLWNNDFDDYFYQGPLFEVRADIHTSNPCGRLLREPVFRSASALLLTMRSSRSSCFTFYRHHSPPLSISFVWLAAHPWRWVRIRTHTAIPRSVSTMYQLTCVQLNIKLTLTVSNVTALHSQQRLSSQAQRPASVWA